MANKSYAEQIKLIKQDARKAYEGIIKDLAREASKDLVNTTRSIIQDFYDSYSPEYYARTKNLFNMIMPKIAYKTGKGNAYIASISTMSVLMNDNYGYTSKRNITPDNIYDLMWNQGHRGLPFQTLEPTWYPKINIDGLLIASKSPDLLMGNYIRNWYKIGSKKINNIDKKYKSDKCISFK